MEKKEPKKRVAFSTPKDAATKAMYNRPSIGCFWVRLTKYRSIVRNASNSPLLQLPLEVRNQIWAEVLGDRLVHVKYRQFYALRFRDHASPYCTFNRDQDSCRSPWRHIVCENDCPENRHDESMVIGRGDPLDTLWKEPHSCFKNNYDPFDYKSSAGPSVGFRDHQTMHLTLLRTSRQIYVEANQVLWKSNMFSFLDGVTLKRFMETRSIHQKRLIHNLRLHIDCHHKEYVRAWNSALDMAAVRSLSGLQSLRIKIVYCAETRGCQLNHDSRALLIHTSYFQGLWRLSTLPLSDVEVTVMNSRCTLTKDLWNQNKLDEVGDGLKTMLRNPKGAEIYAAAQPKIKGSRRRTRAGSDLKSDEETDASSSYFYDTIRLLAVTSIGRDYQGSV